MNYTVLSRKWRPQVFTQVVGQHHVTETLQNAIKLNRVAHAYMFCGPRGVGKTTIARILSKTVNCVNQTNSNPCNECSNCTEITGGASLDVLEFDGASNRGIDEIRDLRESVKYPPNSTQYKVFIIDEVHMLTKEAFNALLKTLEEPPSHAIFIFATTDPHKVPQTILSRTQRYDLKRISYDLIISHTKKVLDDEGIGYEIEALALISRKSEGSLRDALSLLDQVIAYADNKVTNECTKDILGIVDEAVYFDLMFNLLSRNAFETIGVLKKTVDSGISIHDFIDGYINFIRSCILLYNGYSKDDNFLSNDCIQKIKNLKIIDSEIMINILDSLINTKITVKGFQQPYIAYETLFLKLSTNSGSNIKSVSHNINQDSIDVSTFKEDSKDIDASKDAENLTKETSLGNENILEASKDGNISNDVYRETKQSDQNNVRQESNDSINNDVLDLNDVQSKWIDVVRLVEKKNPKVAQFIDQVNIIEMDDNSIVVKLIDAHSFHIDALEKDRTLVEDAFSQIFNLQLGIYYKVDESVKGKMKSKKNDGESEEHPLFIKAIEDFDGELLR